MRNLVASILILLFLLFNFNSALAFDFAPEVGDMAPDFKLEGFNKKIKTKVDKQILIDNGLVQKKDLVKILGRGELSSKLTVTADAFSESAKNAIEKVGGKINTSE